jgi:ATP diphosphatase
MTEQRPSPDCEAILRLLEIMAVLRDPQRGCPWDLEQNFATVAPHTLEEAYEVVEAIEGGGGTALCEELGDLLFQVVFHAQMAAEQGAFRFADVVASINDKLVRRHPHVFADAQVRDAHEQTEAWERHKESERAERGTSGAGALDGVALSLPALVRAQKLQRRAARVGFDWPRLDQVVDKLDEELAEFKAALATSSLERQREELGDILFTCVNLARFLGSDAESLLRSANSKFASRFRAMENLAETSRRPLLDCSAEELDVLWRRVKHEPL